VPAKACFHARRSRARAARGPKARPWLQGRGRRERRRYRDDHFGQEISPIASPASAKPASCSAACTHFCSGEEHARPCQVHRTGAVTREPIPKNEAWPQTYEDLQPVPVLSVGQLTTAFDDGLEKGQTYRAKIDYVHRCDLVTHELDPLLWNLETLGRTHQLLIDNRTHRAEKGDYVILCPMSRVSSGSSFFHKLRLRTS
jgi:hypothetical protein